MMEGSPCTPIDAIPTTKTEASYSVFFIGDDSQYRIRAFSTETEAAFDTNTRGPIALIEIHYLPLKGKSRMLFLLSRDRHRRSDSAIRVKGHS